MLRSERPVLQFYARTATQSLRTRLHTALRRDRPYVIGGHKAVLPPGHRLPWFQALFPTYDSYASRLLATLCEGASSPLLIDVGANIGDTTLLAVAAVPGLQVRAVEGNDEFVHYLERNTAHVRPTVDLVTRFVGTPGARPLVYSHQGSTGGFHRTASGSESGAGEHGPTVSVDELLHDADRHDLVIWKSDTDGLDIPILLAAWERLDSACDVIWFEFDPFVDVDEGAGIPALASCIRGSGRVMHVVDNFGRSMMTVAADAAPDVLTGLSSWLARAAVPGDTSYLDLWLVAPGLTHRDPATDALQIGRPHVVGT